MEYIFTHEKSKCDKRSANANTGKSASKNTSKKERIL